MFYELSAAGHVYEVPLAFLLAGALGLLVTIGGAAWLLVLPRAGRGQRLPAGLLAAGVLLAAVAVLGAAAVLLLTGWRTTLVRALWTILSLEAVAVLVAALLVATAVLVAGVPRRGIDLRSRLALSTTLAGLALVLLGPGSHLVLLSQSPLPRFETGHEPLILHPGRTVQLALSSGAQRYAHAELSGGSEVGEQTVTARTSRFWLGARRSVQVRVAEPRLPAFLSLRPGQEWSHRLQRWSANRVGFGLLDPDRREWVRTVRVLETEERGGLAGLRVLLEDDFTAEVFIFGADGEAWLRDGAGVRPLLYAWPPRAQGAQEPLREPPPAQFGFALLPGPCAQLSSGDPEREEPSVPDDCHHDPRHVANVEAIVVSSILTLGLFSYGGDTEERATLLTRRGPGTPAVPPEAVRDAVPPEAVRDAVP